MRTRLSRLGALGIIGLALGCNGGETVGGESAGAGGLGTGGAGGSAGAAGACAAAQASCAQGEQCCAGLTCCSGIPVPAGQEYCAALCPQSDRNLKTAIEPVDDERVLERLMSLPVATWSYRSEGTDVRHMGPMAQDFQATFGLGASDRTILHVDADGVALASIQALHRRLEVLEQENQRLRRRLDRIERGTDAVCREPGAQKGGSP